jgi:hypothetical protein
MFEFSHLLVSPRHIEQFPFGLNPPHDPERGFLLKITPIDIAAIARHKMIIPNIVSII